MKFKKYFPTLLSILTVILIPYFLYKIRNLLKFTIESLSNYSPRLLDLQNSLTTNITLQETLNIQNELSSIHFATQKALAINYFLLPIGIFLIWKFYAAVYDIMLRKKLFKTKDDYINVLIYVSHRLKSGYAVKDIRNTLEKAGWNKKQLDFALRKSIKSYKKIKKIGAKVL